MEKRIMGPVILFLLLCYARPSQASDGLLQEREEVSIGRYQKLHSEILGEDRTLLVHLPRGYETGTQKYPVIYMLYGDHVTTYFAEAVSILDTLGPTGRIPECLLVGIMNSDRYRDLLLLTPEGKPTGIENFTRFLTEEAFPFIEKEYRTQPYRILVGPQAGANFGLFTLFSRPEMFGAVILNNPFRWPGGRDLMLQQVEKTLQERPEFRKAVFITYEDTDPLAREGIGYIDKFKRLIDTRKPLGFSLGLNFIAGHDEFLQPLGLRQGLEKVFERYPFPPDRTVAGLADILSFYQELSGEYGYPVEAPEHVLTVQGDHLQEKGKTAAVIAILEYCMEHYPASANSYFRMSNIYMRQGDLDGARDYLAKTIERIPQDNGMFRSRLEALDKRIAGSAAYQVENAIRAQGRQAGIRRFRELRAPSQSGFYFAESEFNELGYRLLNSGQGKAGLKIFQLNVELNPASVNAFDSLGEAYLKNGDKASAVKNYKKVLELDPGNQNAAKMIQKIEGK